MFQDFFNLNKYHLKNTATVADKSGWQQVSGKVKVNNILAPKMLTTLPFTIAQLIELSQQLLIIIIHNALVVKNRVINIIIERAK